MYQIKSKINYFLKNDIVFKIFFTKNKYMLKKLISMSLKIRESDIKKITILNPDIISERKGEKVGVLDLLVEINNKEQINIEIQNTNKYNFPERLEFYLSSMYTKNIKDGEDYAKLKKVYGIYLLNYNDKNYPNFYAKIVDYDIMNQEITYKVKEKAIYNLTKIKEIDKYGFSEEEKKIIKFIICEDEKELEEMAVSDERIEEAIKQLEAINADEELSRILYYIEKQKLEENTERHLKEKALKEVEKINKKLDKSKVELTRSNKELNEVNNKLNESNKKLNESNRKLNESNKKLSKSNNLLIKSLYENGKSIEEISQIVDLDIEYINKILNTTINLNL